MLLQIIVAYSNLYILVPFFFRSKKYLIYLLIIIVILIVSIAINSFWAEINSDLTGRISRLIPNSALRWSELPTRIQAFPPVFLTSIILLISTVYALARDQNRSEQKRLLLQNEKINAEMKFLRSQLNPHFFFNALNNLNGLMQLDSHKAQEFIGAFSDLLRYVIYESVKGEVSLEQEIMAVESYIYFQKIKDPENIQVRTEFDIQNLKRPIEPMLIIPLVENSFKHGYSGSNPPLFVSIIVKESGTSVFIEISNSTNNGNTQQRDPSYSGIGLDNIKKRLDNLKGVTSSFTLDKSDSNFTVSIKLDYDY